MSHTQPQVQSRHLPTHMAPISKSYLPTTLPVAQSPTTSIVANSVRPSTTPTRSLSSTSLPPLEQDLIWNTTPRMLSHISRANHTTREYATGQGHKATSISHGKLRLKFVELQQRKPDTLRREFISNMAYMTLRLAGQSLRHMTWPSWGKRLSQILATVRSESGNFMIQMVQTFFKIHNKFMFRMMLEAHHRLKRFTLLLGLKTMRESSISKTRTWSNGPMQLVMLHQQLRRPIHHVMGRCPRALGLHWQSSWKELQMCWSCSNQDHSDSWWLSRLRSAFEFRVS